MIVSPHSVSIRSVIDYLTTTFHLEVCVNSDNALMASKHSKNKKVCYESQVSSVNDGPTVYHVLTS